MRSEYAAATNFIKQCHVTYPELDLMEDDTRTMYDKCWSIVKNHEQEEERQIQDQIEAYEAEVIRKPKKVTKKGKLAQFEDDVIECLRQGYGEEKQLYKEALDRKNKWARINYLKAYKRAVVRFRGSR